MEKKIYQFIGLSLVMILAVCMVAGGQAKSAATGQLKTFVYGIADPLSGPSAPWGIANVNVAKMYIQELEAKGGIKIGNDRYIPKLVVYDHKYDPAEAVTAVNRLIFQDKAIFIQEIGGGVNVATVGIANDNKVIMDADGWGEGLIGPDKPYIYRTTLDTWVSAKLFYTWFAKARPEVKRVVYLGPNDEVGKAMYKDTVDWAKKGGIEVVANDFVQRGTTAFQPMLTRLMVNKPDGIDLDGWGAGDMGLLVKQARQLGYKGVLYSTGAQDATSIVGVAGKENAEGLLIGRGFGDPYPGGPNLPASALKFRDDYLKQFGPPFVPNSIEYYNGIIVACAAIEKAQSLDTTKIKDALDGIKFTSVLGPAQLVGKERFGIARQSAHPTTIAQIRDGKGVLVAVAQIE